MNNGENRPRRRYRDKRRREEGCWDGTGQDTTEQLGRESKEQETLTVYVYSSRVTMGRTESTGIKHEQEQEQEQALVRWSNWAIATGTSRSGTEAVTPLVCYVPS